eukprot:gene4482-14644_t
MDSFDNELQFGFDRKASMLVRTGRREPFSQSIGQTSTRAVSQNMSKPRRGKNQRASAFASVSMSGYFDGTTQSAGSAPMPMFMLAAAKEDKKPPSSSTQ